jgi:protein-tyrosine phosphatase
MARLPELLLAPDLRAFPLRHGYWVPGMDILAGEYPGARAGRPEHGKLRNLCASGVSAFVDLTEEDELPSYRHRLEKIWGQDPVSHHRFPIPDLGIPDTPERMAEVLDHLQRMLAEGRRVYLHCMGGVGRTGMTVGCLLVRTGLAPATALDVVAALFAQTPKHPRQSPETEAQREFVRSWRSLDPALP